MTTTIDWSVSEGNGGAVNGNNWRNSIWDRNRFWCRLVRCLSCKLRFDSLVVWDSSLRMPSWFYIDRHVYRPEEAWSLGWSISRPVLQWYSDILHRYETHMCLWKINIQMRSISGCVWCPYRASPIQLESMIRQASDRSAVWSRDKLGDVRWSMRLATNRFSRSSEIRRWEKTELTVFRGSGFSSRQLRGCWRRFLAARDWAQKPCLKLDQVGNWKIHGTSTRIAYTINSKSSCWHWNVRVRCPAGSCLQKDGDQEKTSL